MTRERYAARKLRFQEELQAAMERVQASYHAQLRALERVWSALVRIGRLRIQVRGQGKVGTKYRRA